MVNSWSVVIDEQPYAIQLNNRKLVINGEKSKLKAFNKKKLGFLAGLLSEEYEIPLGSKTATLVLWNMKTPRLIIDNKDVATGEEYVPTVLPKWSYIFILLHFINFFNGAIGVLLAFVGIALTTAVSANSKFNTAVKLVLNVVILVLLVGVVFGIALALASTLY